ncbi:MAG: aspartate kinase [Candidatus Mycalebacterium zealandia]|nr:MAG: aspartate kinase [Candidatus Mycalebacterium zealandia]
MSLVVQKYGGASVSNIGSIGKVAENIIKRAKQGNRIVAVVSAMAGETDRLTNLARKIMDPPDRRELDVIISSGEQVSSGLLCMKIKSLGHEAVSFQGHQVRVTTNNVFSGAKIKTIDDRKIREALDSGMVVVIAGFQGVDDDGNVTTLGRGGSDLTAVAVASVLDADSCELYKDVAGIFSADPLVCKDARKLDKICYEEMLEMASAGSKVLQARAVEHASKFSIPLHVRPMNTPEKEGTLVMEESSMESMEEAIISGVSSDKNQAKLTIADVPDQPGIAAKIFSVLASEDISVDMIVQNISHDGVNDVTFTVPRVEFKRASKATRKLSKEIGARQVESEDNIAKISLIGIGMRSHSGVASRMFKTLAREKINIMMISTSEIKISCIVQERETARAVRALHDEFFGGKKKSGKKK